MKSWIFIELDNNNIKYTRPRIIANDPIIGNTYRTYLSNNGHKFASIEFNKFDDEKIIFSLTNPNRGNWNTVFGQKLIKIFNLTAL